MKGIAAATLLAAATLGLAQNQLKPEINLWVAKDVAPAQKVRLNINTKEIRTLSVTAQRLIDPDVWYLNPNPARAPRVEVKPAGQWQMSMVDKKTETPHQVQHYFSRQINLPPLQPGVYKLTAKGGGQEKWTILNVTHLAVVSKRSNYRNLVWVTDALNGSLIPGARVREFQVQNANAVASGTTGQDGAVLIPSKPGSLLVVTRGNDRAYLGIPEPYKDRPRVHFQTDRPIYRPGQKVQYKAVVRMGAGPEYRAISNAPVEMEVRDSKDQVLDKASLTTTAMGTVSGSFDIPSEAAPGPYTLVLTRGSEKAYSTFTVAEYRKPEYKADVRPAEKRYLAGEELVFHVESSYFFGAPVQQAQIQYVVRRSMLPFWGFSDNDRSFYGGDGNLYASDEYGMNEVVSEDQVVTDAKGAADINVKTDPNLPDQTYSVSLTVTDGSRRQVTSGASVPVYSAAIRLGLRSDMLFVPLGSLIPVEVVARDLDGKPVAANVTLVLSHEVWNEKKDKYETRELARTQVNVPASGKALAKLPANAEGTLDIRATAKDNTGRTAKTSFQMYVAGPDSKAEKEEEQPSVQLRLDRKAYKPGDTANTNVAGARTGSPILLVAEGEDIFEYKVVPRSGATWALKTRRAMSPNAFVTATQWWKGQMLAGTKILPLPDPQRTLKVTATPDKPQYRPGETATYTLHTTDEAGKPIAAEIALSVVDEAIYALRPDSTPDLVSFYWGRRENRVTTHYSAPEEVSGGAFQRANPAAPVRQRFEDTAYWSPTVNTGPDGTATVTFEMPGNLTTWRATARAVTLETRVGTGLSSVLANRPVMMRLATPRQMVVGDELSIVSSVNNRTEASHDFTALLQPEGIKLEGATTQPITVASNAESRTEWRLHADALPDGGNATLLGTTEPRGERNLDLSDALKVGFKIVPRGVVERGLVGGVVKDRAEASFTLPEDRIEPASVVRVRVWSGLQPAMREAADAVLRTYRYGPMVAADQLQISALLGQTNKDEAVRESLAMLSRTQSYEGWGWWEGQSAKSNVTAHVLTALARARANGVNVSDKMFAGARFGILQLYARDGLWENRAQLAAAVVITGEPAAKDLVSEVLRRGIKLSPYARLRLAEALALLGDKDQGSKLVDEVLADAIIGPSTARIPAGEGTGWQATDTETTAQGLLALHALGVHEDIQSKLAGDLASPSESWRPVEDQAAAAVALAVYGKDHPDASELGDVHLSLNGTALEPQASHVSNSVGANVPRAALQSSNSLRIERSSGGEAFYEVQTLTYRPDLETADVGLGVLRRIELKTPNGVWREFRPGETIQAGDSIRATVLVWGRGQQQPTRVTEPIPAGFEYVEDERGLDCRQEVRDGAVVHYVMTTSEPIHFSYYLRSESAGKVIALPATAELLSSPDKRGQSGAQVLEIKAP